MALSFVFAALVVLLDQLFKRLTIITLSAGGEIVLIPHVIGLIYVRNYGAAFGIFQDMRWPLAGIQFVLCLLLVAVLMRYNTGFWGKLGLSAFLGGGVGNLIDRVFRGYVVDMFELQFMNFAIFNIADIFITLGGIVFFINFMFSGKKKEPDKMPDNVTDFPRAYDVDVEPQDFERIVAETRPIPTASAVQDSTPDFKPAPQAEPVPEFEAIMNNLQDAETADFPETKKSDEEYDLNRILREYGLESNDN